MDIVALSMIKSQTQVQQDVGLSVMKKAMGQAEQKSDFINQMMNTETQNVKVNLPHMGNHIDTYA